VSILIIKIAKNGSYQEYKLHGLGPFTLGSDKKSDLWIDDSQVEAKLLEVKISSGEIYVRETGSRGNISLNSSIPAFHQSIRYDEGTCINIKNTDIQIYINQSKDEMIGPPPFFEEEFKERLNRMGLKIHEKEIEIKNLDNIKNEKSRQLTELENNLLSSKNDKTKIEIEVSSLKSQKILITEELRKGKNQNQEIIDNIKHLNELANQFKDEEMALKEKISSQKSILDGLHKERELNSEEVEKQKTFLSELELESKNTEKQLTVLLDESSYYKNEIQDENSKIQKVLINSEAALVEQNKIQQEIAKALKEKALLDYEYKDLVANIRILETQKEGAQNSINELKGVINQEEINAKNIQEKIYRQEADEKTLALLNTELRTELIKVEEQLIYKKNQLNQTEYQNQDTTRKLSAANYELERSSSRLKELSNEEKTQEIKVKIVREELQTLQRNFINEKKKNIEISESEKTKHNKEINRLLARIEENKIFKENLTTEHELIKIKIENLEIQYNQKQGEKTNLQTSTEEIISTKSQLETQIIKLKNEASSIENSKTHMQHELLLLQIKLTDCEVKIKEKQEKSFLEIENLKRDARSKLEAERGIQLIEIEAHKQRSMIEIENSFRQKQDDLYLLKNIAQEQVDEILNSARKIEKELTQEATLRLNNATIDAQEREAFSHKRVLEAQEYFRQKEDEAKSIVNEAQISSKYLLKKTEDEITTELITRKLKIKNFLNMKQEVGLAHINSLTEQSIIRLKKNEEKSKRNLEDLKRRELKKVAKVRDEELALNSEIKLAAIKNLKVEKDKLLKQFLDLKSKQETELAEKKKSVIDHINAMKIEGQKQWQDELRKEKDTFQYTKKERISNASMAIMNVLISEGNLAEEREIYLKEKIHSTLEMAINGQNATSINQLGQILDFNPLKRKKLVPVFKKYAVNFGIPAIIAITLLTDIGSIRTLIVKQTNELLKQNNSASEMYVNKQKTEWKEKHYYTPIQTADYKNSFTNNVIYTTDFEKIMDNEEFQNDWILKVHNFLVKDLELPEDSAINYISSEGALIKELFKLRQELHPKFLEQGLKKMQEYEENQIGWLKTKIAMPEKFEKFLTFRKNHYDNFYNDKLKNTREVANKLDP
jgi:hypothetical protein